MEMVNLILSISYLNSNSRTLSILRNTSIGQTISFDETVIDTTGGYSIFTPADFNGDRQTGYSFKE
jgi:hypothetical protein